MHYIDSPANLDVGTFRNPGIPRKAAAFNAFSGIISTPQQIWTSEHSENLEYPVKALHLMHFPALYRLASKFIGAVAKPEMHWVGANQKQKSYIYI